MRQVCHHYKQYTDDDHRGAAEAREGLFGIKYACHVEDTDGTQKHQVGTQFGKQQHAEHGQYGDNGNPCVQAEA